MGLEGSITQEEREFVETWESVTESQNFIIHEDRRGDPAPELIQGFRRFKITTYERILTQDRIADKRHDPFANGCFRPIIVPSTINVETNPNALSEDDIRRIFVASDIAWEEYMRVVDSPATLKRMIDIAEDSDLPVRRYRELEAKYSEYSNVGRRVEQKDQAEFDKMGPVGSGSAEPVRKVRRSTAR